MAAESRVREGYLVIADISGYTSFLAGSELEHGHAIIEELIQIILRKLSAPLRLVKLEGDAVFCFAPAQATTGEQLLEQIESCYFEFAAHLEDSKRATTCKCAACQAMPTLDLKFFAHYGQFIVQRLAGREDLAGPDVILLHRMVKNAIVEKLGIPAYAFLTEACVARTPKELPLIAHRETYEHLGEVRGGVQDLTAAYRAMREARHEFIGPDDATSRFTVELSAPPAVVWSHHLDPALRLEWDGSDRIELERNSGGRTGVGATIHCCHGKQVAVNRLTDMRPFHYYTMALSFRGVPLPDVKYTVELSPLEGGRTRLEMRMRPASRNVFAVLMLRLTQGSYLKTLAKEYGKLESALLEQAQRRVSAA